MVTTDMEIQCPNFTCPQLCRPDTKHVWCRHDLRSHRTLDHLTNCVVNNIYDECYLRQSIIYMLCNPPVVWLWESVLESPSSLHQKCPLLLVTMGVATVSPRHCPLQLHCSQPDSVFCLCSSLHDGRFYIILIHIYKNFGLKNIFSKTHKISKISM